MHTDLHIVIEARQACDGTWAYRKVTPALPWASAQTEWNRLDVIPVQGAGRHSTHPHGAYFMVRAADDPQWAFLNTPKARTTIERAGRDYAATAGYSGRQGGWIYRPDGRAVTQGWLIFAQSAARTGHVRTLTIEGSTNPMWWAVEIPFTSEAVVSA